MSLTYSSYCDAFAFAFASLFASSCRDGSSRYLVTHSVAAISPLCRHDSLVHCTTQLVKRYQEKQTAFQNGQ